MFVSLDKGNEKGNVVLAEFLGNGGVCLRYRKERSVKEIFLSPLELKTLFKRAIKKDRISKEDL